MPPAEQRQTGSGQHRGGRDRQRHQHRGAGIAVADLGEVGRQQILQFLAQEFGEPCPIDQHGGIILTKW